MKYIYLKSQEQCILLEGILQIKKIEEKDEKIILIEYLKGTLIKLDYTEIKDDINEEDSIIEKDFEELIKALKDPNKEYELIKKDNRISYLEQIYEIKSKNYDNLLTYLKKIINRKDFSFKKIKNIKEVIK